MAADGLSKKEKKKLLQKAVANGEKVSKEVYKSVYGYQVCLLIRCPLSALSETLSDIVHKRAYAQNVVGSVADILCPPRQHVYITTSDYTRFNFSQFRFSLVAGYSIRQADATWQAY